MRHERGEALVEVVVAVSIVAMVCAALLGGMVAATHRFGPDISRTALVHAAEREMRVAVDVLKYQGNTIVPATVATTIPMPGATPVAAHLSISTTNLGSGATVVTIDAMLDANAAKAVTISTTVPPPVPLPSSNIFVDGGAPQ